MSCGSMFLVAVLSLSFVPSPVFKSEGHVFTLHGTLKSVDTKAMQIVLTLDSKKEDVPVMTDDKTKITVDGKPAKLEDLKEGMTATAKGEMRKPALEITALTAKK